MNMRKNLDISAYLVVGPENTLGRPVADIIRAAVENGFTCLQIRSKTASARELIALCREAADVLRELGKSDEASCSSTTGSTLHWRRAMRASRSMASTSARVTSRQLSAASTSERRPLSACRRARMNCSTMCAMLTQALSTTSAQDLSMRRRRRRTAVAMLRAMSSREVSRS